MHFITPLTDTWMQQLSFKFSFSFACLASKPDVTKLLHAVAKDKLGETNKGRIELLLQFYPPAATIDNYRSLAHCVCWMQLRAGALEHHSNILVLCNYRKPKDWSALVLIQWSLTAWHCLCGDRLLQDEFCATETTWWESLVFYRCLSWVKINYNSTCCSSL